MFFLFWDDNYGYAYINSGKVWKREVDQLVSVGPATLAISSQLCEQTKPPEAKIIKTPWIVSFKIQALKKRTTMQS